MSKMCVVTLGLLLRPNIFRLFAVAIAMSSARPRMAFATTPT
jgi:hypothetical protein